MKQLFMSSVNSEKVVLLVVNGFDVEVITAMSDVMIKMIISTVSTVTIAFAACTNGPVKTLVRLLN
jgi:hypothetical protein